MSAVLQQNGALRSIAAKPQVLTRVTVYEAASRSLPRMMSANLANRTDSAAAVTLEWYQASSMLSVAIVSSTLAAKSRIIVDDIVIAMREGDRIDLTAGAIDTVECILTVMEPPGASQ